MWALNQDFTAAGISLFGRNSRGALHQPRLAWRNSALDLEHAAYPSGQVGWTTSNSLAIPDKNVGAVWAGIYLARSGHREASVVLGKFAARLRFVEWQDAEQNGVTEWRSHTTTGTADYLVLELMQDGEITLSRILHAAGDGRATIAAGFARVGSQWRFVAWATISPDNLPTPFGVMSQSDYGSCTAVVSCGVESDDEIQSEVKYVSGAPSLRLVSAAEHYGPFMQTFAAYPEDVSVLIARAGGPPGSLRQRNRNALVPVMSLPEFDCGQMIELSRNSNDGEFFTHCLMAYDFCHSMPYLPNEAAGNLHYSQQVNDLLARVRVTLSMSTPSGKSVSGSIDCTNDGSGLNDYRGAAQLGGSSIRALVSLFRMQVNTGGSLETANLVVVYGAKVSLRALLDDGQIASAQHYKTATPQQMAGFFGGGGFSLDTSNTIYKTTFSSNQLEGALSISGIGQT